MTTDLTQDEIDVRERVWSASQAGAPLWLTREDVAALWSSILKTGRELSIRRAQETGEPVFKLTPSEALREEFRGRTAS